MISRTARHAIRALARLATLPEGRFAGAPSLAREVSAPGNYLGKLLQALARRGLLRSRKGQGGGFRLAREPRSITLLDIVDPIDGVRPWNDCFLGGPTCNDDAPCAVHTNWAALRESYLALLSGTTLADVADHAITAPEPDANDNEDPLQLLKESDR